MPTSTQGLTREADNRELVGLVYSLTEKPSDTHLRWYKRPAALAGVVRALSVLLNLVFW